MMLPSTTTAHSLVTDHSFTEGFMREELLLHIKTCQCGDSFSDIWQNDSEFQFNFSLS